MQDFKTRLRALCDALRGDGLNESTVVTLSKATEHSVIAIIEAVPPSHMAWTTALNQFASEHLKAQVSELQDEASQHKADAERERHHRTEVQAEMGKLQTALDDASLKLKNVHRRLQHELAGRSREQRATPPRTGDATGHTLPESTVDGGELGAEQRAHPERFYFVMRCDGCKLPYSPGGGDAGSCTCSHIGELGLNLDIERIPTGAPPQSALLGGCQWFRRYRKAEPCRDVRIAIVGDSLSNDGMAEILWHGGRNLVHPTVFVAMEWLDGQLSPLSWTPLAEWAAIPYERAPESEHHADRASAGRLKSELDEALRKMHASQPAVPGFVGCVEPGDSAIDDYVEDFIAKAGLVAPTPHKPIPGICPRTGDDLTDHNPGFERRAAAAIADGTPTYGATCSACGHKWQHPMTFATDGRCHKCGGKIAEIVEALKAKPPTAATPTPQPLTQGDTVRLKSGGPLMTVRTILTDKLVCVWFLDGAVVREAIGMALLRKADRHHGDPAQGAVGGQVLEAVADGGTHVHIHTSDPICAAMAVTAASGSTPKRDDDHTTGCARPDEPEDLAGSIIAKEKEAAAATRPDGGAAFVDSTEAARELLGNDTTFDFGPGDIAAELEVAALASRLGVPLSGGVALIAKEEEEEEADAKSWQASRAVNALHEAVVRVREATGAKVTVHTGDPKCGAALIAREREAQKASQSSDISDAERRPYRSLTIGAIMLAQWDTGGVSFDNKHGWWSDVAEGCNDRKHRLTVAGALIAAEIDRLQAKEAKASDKPDCKMCGDVMLTSVGDACPACQPDE